MSWIIAKLRQPSTYAGLATALTAVVQTGSFKAAIPVILAGLGSVLADA